MVILLGVALNWWLYFLVFVFGYITCKTFYFFRASRVSLSLIKTSQIIYLSSMVKSLENLAYAREIAREHMIRSEKESNEITAFELKFELENTIVKERSIEAMKGCYDKIFLNTIEYDSWAAAMDFLQQNRTAALTFWDIRNDK